jgi:hypothetical protein
MGSVGGTIGCNNVSSCCLYQSEVRTSFGVQGIVCAFFDDFALVHNTNLVGISNRRETVRNHDRRALMLRKKAIKSSLIPHFQQMESYS